MANEKRLIDANKLNVCTINVGTMMFPRFEAFVRVEDIEAAPIVDAVEVVHGRYVHKGAWHIECSECHHILAHIGESKNYCPSCGAKMTED